MPTWQSGSRFVETDLGWGVSRPVRDLAGEVVGLEIECKGCKVKQLFGNDPAIFSRFDHLATCRVLAEVKSTSDPWIGQGRPKP
jgi:hypothetical protein